MLAGPAGAARSRAPALAPDDALVDGPSPDIRSLDGMSIARDGGGALVYTKTVGAVAHVFLSRLSAGAFQAPVQVDAGLAGPSSQPVVAAGQGGLVLVAFINSGTLYVAQALSASSPLSAPAALFPGAANPSISLTNFGKAYLAFTATAGAGGGDVRAAYYYQGQWGLESTPLDAVAGDAAGVGTGRPDVAASGDGVGIVAWGEAGHIYTRRVIGTTPSSVVEQADPATYGGWSETSASRPAIASGGDSTYAIVAFQASLANGSATQSRVLTNHLHGSTYDGVTAADGATTGGPEGADQPQTAVTEYGTGFVTSETSQSHMLYATALGGSESRGPTGRVDSLPNSSAPDAVPASAGLISTLIAWQQTPGIAGPAEIRLRYASDGADLLPEQVISTPALGATDADLGLAAAGDVAGDAAAAWVQGSGASTSIVAAQLFQAPGGFVPSNSFRYVVTGVPLAALVALGRAVGCADLRPAHRRHPGGPDHRHPDGGAGAPGQRPPHLPAERGQPGGRHHQLPRGDGVRRHRASARHVEAERHIDRQHPRAAARQLRRSPAGRACPSPTPPGCPPSTSTGVTIPPARASAAPRRATSTRGSAPTRSRSRSPTGRATAP